MFTAIISTVGLRTLALLLAARGGSAEFVCEGEGPVDATYDFGQFDGRFVEAIKPVSGCNLVLQAKGTNWAEWVTEIKAFPYCVDSQPEKNQELKTSLSKGFYAYTEPHVGWGDKWLLLELPQNIKKYAEILVVNQDYKLYEIVDNEKRSYKDWQPQDVPFLANPYRFAVNGPDHTFVYTAQEKQCTYHEFASFSSEPSQEDTA